MKLAKLATSALVFASVVLSAGMASAQVAPTRGMTANYLGAGVAAGVTNGGQDNDAATFGGNIQGRFAVPQAPVSVRGSVLFGGDSTAAMPILTYDAPIGKNTNVYIGGGYSFQTDEGQASQLGNQNAPVLTLGAETEVAKNIIVYGDAKWGIDAYENSSADALSLQTGVGLRF
ncbi:outer membrane beta-barrel protein [Mastigocladopsis repens]|uniref:outer membrane beta-barrel protein n=1 Tax=Mastigocladopsis repens TaxID=221287 RepID=UPI0002F1F94A|nr:outer membrane beta-barrel protein [Mastigocladopsis repens]